VTQHAYHGLTEATDALSPDEWADEPPSHVVTVPAPDGYRGRYPRRDPGWAKRFARHIEDAASALTARGLRPAAVMMDTAFTSDGILPSPPAYLQDVVRRTHAAGALFVADEVQAGFGRTGHFWGFDASGIAPDIVTLGKPMGNGHPVAAVVTRSDIAQAFATSGELFSTFGGNPVACAAGLAVLDVLEREALPDSAGAVGAYLRERLDSLSASHPCIGDVRGRGLLIGVELIRDRNTKEPASLEADAVANTMRERGVLIGTTGPAGNVLKIRPPLVFTRGNADTLIMVLGEALNDLHG
jgi:4-aminobutyrate aminotransferase-like enzyme